MCKLNTKRVLCVVYDADGKEIGRHDLESFDEFDPKVYEEQMPIKVKRYIETFVEVQPMVYSKNKKR